MRIGVDVGGTNTDAVLMDDDRVLAWAKATTSEDVSGGIVAAISEVLRRAGVSANVVRTVMIGTTHFTNAFVERRGLVEVGIIRLALPASGGLPPLVDWPDILAETVGRHVFLTRGGYEVTGEKIAPLDETAVADAARSLKRAGVKPIAISSVFSQLNASMEQRAAEIVRAEHPQAEITLSSEIGRIGLLERENAAIMNASLSGIAGRVIQSFHAALTSLDIAAPYYVSQNDGTLMTAEHAMRFPVLTFASGPTNSMRGAAFLSGVHDAVVVDIGGTTSDVGVLASGFPRESAIAVDIGGVRTNFRMPDIISIGVGGGSLVVAGPPLAVGPRSVGYRLDPEALVFGGKTLTATDIAVAAGLAEVGSKSKVASLPADLVEAALAEMKTKIENAVDCVKTSAGATPVILVGGGAILIRDTLAGASEILRPEHAPVANAIGAAIAQVGGEVDRVFSYEKLGRGPALDEAKREAAANAVAAGATPGGVRVIDVEELPLSYMPGGACRVRVKAVGDLALPKNAA